MENSISMASSEGRKPAGEEAGFSSDGVMRVLSEEPAEAFITIGALARAQGCHPASVKRAIKRGELPEPIKLFQERGWLVECLLQFLRDRLKGEQDRVLTAGKQTDSGGKRCPKGTV
jgi:hypothetical protein